MLNCEPHELMKVPPSPSPLARTLTGDWPTCCALRCLQTLTLRLMQLALLLSVEDLESVQISLTIGVRGYCCHQPAGADDWRSHFLNKQTLPEFCHSLVHRSATEKPIFELKER